MIEPNTNYNTRFSYCLVNPTRRHLATYMRRIGDAEQKKKKKMRIRINRPLQHATHACISYVWANGGRTQS